MATYFRQFMAENIHMKLTLTLTLELKVKLQLNPKQLQTATPMQVLTD